MKIVTVGGEDADVAGSADKEMKLGTKGVNGAIRRPSTNGFRLGSLESDYLLVRVEYLWQERFDRIACLAWEKSFSQVLMV